MIYGVYVKIDEEGRITAVDSDGFLEDTKGWKLIDEGSGDRYYLAQGNYFDQPVMDERGICRYKMENGKPAERSREEMDADDVKQEGMSLTEERLAALEDENRYLKETLEIILSGRTEEEDDGESMEEAGVCI